jgi:uncharacterized membrane protein
MQRYSEGKSREQVQVLSLEDMISEENPTIVSVNPMQVWIYIWSLIWIIGIAVLLIYEV